jgi:SPOR domain
MTAGSPAEPVSHDGAEPGACAHCGVPLEDDQEWCLECGAARTLVHDPPDWRIPVALVCAVILIVLAGFAVGVEHLSSGGDPLPAGKAMPDATRPAASAGYAPWPAGLSGWTVVLAASADQATADADAARLAAAGVAVGVLDAADHPAMHSRNWLVYAGRYPDESRAQAAATRLVAAGNAGATAREVAAPGGV